MEKRFSHDWSQLPPELLELVVSKLPSMERPRFSAVCSSWNAASKSKSGFPPLLLLPLEVRSDYPPPVPSISSTTNQGSEEKFHENMVNGRVLRFYSLDVKKSLLYEPLNKKIEVGKRLYQDFISIGSSHGWIVVLDLNNELSLINPFTGAEIELPRKKTFPYPAEEHLFGLTLPLFRKAILTGNPSNGADYKVVVIYGYPDRLAFCSHGDMTWTDLPDSKNSADVACCGNKLCTLELHDEADFMIIDVWDLSVVGEPRRSSHILIPSFKQELEDVRQRYPSALKVSCYLVPSLEEILLVVRVVGKLDAGNGFVVGSQGEVCPYITLGFQVYEVVGLDDYGKELVEVESLVGRAIFVGRSHSMVISVAEHDGLGMNHNSIYFADDNWNRMDDTYRGHDFGIYSLEDKSVRLLFNVQKYQFVPFWVFPGWK